MNKLKLLIEQRNAAVSKMEGLVTSMETENRNLTDEEQVGFDTLENEIRELDAKITAEKEERRQGAKEEPAMNTNEEKAKELRGLSDFVRMQETEEVRTLQTTAQGAAVIPENVYAQIVRKMEETSNIFSKARKFPTVSGSLKIPKENLDSQAGFVGEGENVAEIGIDLGHVKLTQKRVGAAIALTQQFINDSAVDIASYAVDLLARRTVKAIEKSMLVGQGDTNDEFVGMAVAADVAEIATAGAVSVDTLMELYTSLHPAFLDGAEFIVSRKFFNGVAKLKDGNGHFYLQNGSVNGRPHYTLLGVPVNVTDSLTDEVPAIFANVAAAYALMVKKGFELKHVISDTTQAMRGSQLLVLDGYMDGAVYNEQAISRLKVTV